MRRFIPSRLYKSTPWIEDPFDPPIEVIRPARPAGPFVFASPHSGRIYPADFVTASALDALTLRSSEDAFVDELFADAPALGAPLITARFPRAYLDANREPGELDPSMFRDAPPAQVNGHTSRVAAGLGAIPRVVAGGAQIYRHPIAFAEADRRIRTLHTPYHNELERLLRQARDGFGQAVLIDCHSMPSVGGPGDRDRGRVRVDIAIGDRYGSSCAPALVGVIEDTFASLGYAVARNTPYAGGYSTERYGRPALGEHAVQIEINRALYLDETTLKRTSGFDRLKADLATFVTALLDAHDAGRLA